MIRYRVRRLLKFRSSAPRETTTGTRRTAFKRRLGAPAKFAKLFQTTATAYRKANAAEKRQGMLPTSQLQEMIYKWARDILGIISVDVEIKGVSPEMRAPVLFVGNHVSYVDIPLLMASVPVVFVAKEEVSKWLIIGNSARRAGTVFVKRNSDKSRANAAEAILESIVKHRRSIAIFPSGTTCITETKPWRHGAFKIAEKHQIPVQPFRIRYEPLRDVAYIDDDMLATHMMALLRHEKIKAFIEFGPVRMIEDAARDCDAIRDWTREFFRNP